jgi:mRNA interferase RelE/StbE
VAHRILFVSRAERGFKRLSADVQDRIISEINSLAEDPRPAGAGKLAGSENLYRVRIGDYRVIYAVEGDFLLVLVVEVGHRREIYRKPYRRLTRQSLLSLVSDKTQ